MVANAGDAWREERADARVALTVEGDLYARSPAEFETTIDFNALLGPTRVLAADSLRLRRADTGEAVALDLAQDRDIRYWSGNPILRVRWRCDRFAAFERRVWRLYFRTAAPRAQDAWRPLAQTFAPGRPGVLMDTSFEQPNSKRPTAPRGWLPGGRDVKGEKTERVWTNEDAHTGKRCLKIARTFEHGRPRNTNHPFWWSWAQPMPVRPGQGVRVSAWLKAKRLEPRSAAIVSLEFRDAKRKRIRSRRLLLRGKPFPHDWIQVLGSTLAPPRAAQAVAWFTLWGGGEAYCDDVRVTTAPGAEPPALRVEVGPLETRGAQTAAAARRSKTLVCAPARRPPVIDGALDEPCWRRAGRADDFIPFRTASRLRVKTTVLACADRRALYFGFLCSEPPGARLRAAATGRDGRVWDDDSVELFLDTNRDLHTYYQIIVNPRGAFFDQDTGAAGLAGPKWDGPVAAAARRRPDGWSAEVKLEFAGLRLAEAKSRVWGANFARTSLRGGRSLYVWAPVRRNFGEPERFGRLVLPFDPTADIVTGRPLDRERVFWGEGALRFEATNRRSEPAAVRVSAALETPDGPRRLGQTTAELAPHSAAELRIPAVFRQPGEARVQYELADAASGKRLFAACVAHVVPPPLRIEPDTLVSYASERAARGRWELGLSPEARRGAELEFAVSKESQGAPLSVSLVSPTAARGAFAVDTARLPPGRYVLRARLRLHGALVAEASRRFERIPGPFPSPK